MLSSCDHTLPRTLLPPPALPQLFVLRLWFSFLTLLIETLEGKGEESLAVTEGLGLVGAEGVLDPRGVSGEAA